MNELLVRLFERIIKADYKSIIIGILLTPVFFFMIGGMFGVNAFDHLTFLINKHYEAEREKLVLQLDRFNKEIGEYEIKTHEKQVVLWKILDSRLSGREHRKALQIANRNQDVIRALLELGKIYTSLVKTNNHTEDTHNYLSLLYEAILYILRDDDPAISDAFNKLIEINKHISEFPDEVKDDVQIEVLRYLSYCAHRLDKRADQEIFNAQALDLRKKNPRSSLEYRRKYYWVDLSQLASLVNEADFNQAKKVFRSLRNNLGNADLLKTKLLQHQDLIKDQFKDEWKKYIASL